MEMILPDEILVGDAIAYNSPGVGWTTLHVRYVSLTNDEEPKVHVAEEPPQPGRRRPAKTPKAKRAYLNRDERVRLESRTAVDPYQRL